MLTYYKDRNKKIYAIDDNRRKKNDWIKISEKDADILSKESSKLADDWNDFIDTRFQEIYSWKNREKSDAILTYMYFQRFGELPDPFPSSIINKI